MVYNELIRYNIAPYLAKKIGIYDSNGNRVGKIDLGNFKPEYGERLYRFGLLSDVHNQSNQTAEPTADLQRALEFFNNKESVAFTCICGDITQNGTAAELAIYQNNVATKSPNTPVYTCTGNHDCTSSGLNESNWTTYTGHEKNFVFTHQNDVFIFFSMTYWSLGESGTPYSDSDINWLEQQLQENVDKRVFIFTHLFFPTRAGNLNDIYPAGNWLGGNQLVRLQRLNDTYRNAIWFSGHSHWKWYLQKYQDRANIYKENCGWCVHVPSCASPIDSDGSTRVSMPLESEGAIVDVYENYIDIRAMDLKNELYIPIAHYRLSTLEEDNYESVNKLVWEAGGIDSSTGVDNGESTNWRTKYLVYNEGSTYAIETYEQLISLRVFFYDLDKTFISRTDYIETVGLTNLEIPENTAFIRIRFADSYSRYTADTISEALNLLVDGVALESGGIENGSELPEGYTVLTVDNFTVRSGSPTISGPDSDGWITITFTAKGEKFWVKTDDMDANTVGVNLVSMEYQCDKEEALDGLGFYNIYGYYYLSETMLDYDPSNGVQFNISGSQFAGTVPLTIKVRNIILKCYK